jgi:hypothetical protein
MATALAGYVVDDGKTYRVQETERLVVELIQFYDADAKVRHGAYDHYKAEHDQSDGWGKAKVLPISDLIAKGWAFENITVTGDGENGVFVFGTFNRYPLEAIG